MLKVNINKAGPIKEPYSFEDFVKQHFLKSASTLYFKMIP